MKKLIMIVACALVCTTALSHIVMTVYETYERGTDYEYQSNTMYYLDDIISMEIFANYDGVDESRQGESGIRINDIEYFTSTLDSIVWSDYVDPGLSGFDVELTDSKYVLDECITKLYRCLNCFDNYDNFLQILNLNNHPTLDTQAMGWDHSYNTQNYDAKDGHVSLLWNHCYSSIFRCNELLPALETSTCYTDAEKQELIGEVRAIRGFFYMQLATTYGRVLIFDSGETHATAGTQRARIGSYEEMWDFVIADFKAASEQLDWTPRVAMRSNGHNGTMNKGIALSYLGDAYMWKAYCCPDQAKGCYQDAADALKQVIDCGKYSLNRSFTTLWDPIPLDANYDWNRETIMVQIFEQSGSWADDVPHSFSKFYAASPANGGWGSLFLSWEWYNAYEKGDKRRDASCVTANIPADKMAEYNLDYSDINRLGYHPYLKERVGGEYGYNNEENSSFKYGYGEVAPAIWSMKYWRNSPANWNSPWSATNIYWKRLPNVMLDYAECCFNLDNEDAGWNIINDLRERAFGNLEVDHADEIVDKYLPELQRVIADATYYSIFHDSYPVPMNTEMTNVTDAKVYYTDLKEKKGFTSPAWKVAVNEERRKEFNGEPCLRPDMVRSGYMEDHIAHNYPIDNHDMNDNQYPWTTRTFGFDSQKMEFPIPIEELRRNADCDQNPGY